MESPLGPIFLGLEGNGKIIISNQLERLKGCLAGKFDKPSSERFLNGMEGLTDKESLWVVQAVDGDLKKQMEEGEPADPAEKEMKSFQFCMTLSDGIRGKLTIATTASRHASPIKALLATRMKEIEVELAKIFKDPKARFPEEEDDGIEKVGGFVEAGIAYLAIKQGKLEVQGNDMVLLVGANRKSLEPLFQALGLSGK